jgi:hypothetical protein
MSRFFRFTKPSRAEHISAIDGGYPSFGTGTNVFGKQREHDLRIDAEVMTIQKALRLASRTLALALLAFFRALGEDSPLLSASLERLACQSGFSRGFHSLSTLETP